MTIAVDALQKKIEDLANLPTMPGVVRTVASMVEDENANVQDIAALISRDQVLSAKILRLVNSPMYGFPGRISSISHAMMLLGFNVVKGLVLTAAIFDSFAAGARGLWEHSLGTAILSRRIARELGLKDAEEIMIAGLLHDLGKVILSHLYGEDYQQAREMATARRIPIARAELEIFGVDHEQVGQWIATAWHLPPRLVDTLTYHHHPSRAKHAANYATIVQLADILARGMGYGDGGDPIIAEIDQEAYNALHLSTEHIERVLAGADQEFASGAHLLEELADTPVS